jgi:hypothetical protein
MFRRRQYTLCTYFAKLVQIPPKLREVVAGAAIGCEADQQAGARPFSRESDRVDDLGIIVGGFFRDR